ncbi:hypothetical protein VIBNISO65_670021 [Vibrio nigripulchritudo SO65]|nr:hypothetical protein VIBNIAM115_690018 [Vibrio nigripulchritudo AM115]CCN39179.1 hypothetical protein VIBNIFTn2_1010018 [Vibrio nigripulchritudo FTn2]CCN67245.1 hypothetical protein VIBNIPon4_730020 [Vibrio nigripulchritudo POn4]CCN78559.1 hypothetical protein VIBNISO65_670021 [Vibrio nigripulchritudo SO65]
MKIKSELVDASAYSCKQKRSAYGAAFLFQLLQAINLDPIQGYL